MTKPLRVDLTGQDYRRDPFPVLDALRAVGPLVRVRLPVIGTVQMTTTHAAAEAVLKDTGTFSNDIAHSGRGRMARIVRFMPRSMRLLTQSMLQADGEAHRRLRRTVDASFRRARIEAWRPRIAIVADELLDRWQASGDGDLMAHVARDLPLAVICELLGLPRHDRPRFMRWIARFSQVNSVMALVRLIPVLSRIGRYLRARFAEKRADPGDDLIGEMLAGGELDDDEALAMCFLLFVAGHETTTHLIGGGILTLLQNPDEMVTLRADPGLAANAVDELLRHVSPVEMTNPRFARRDADLAGLSVAKGAPVMASLAAANGDPAIFVDPHRLDLSRRPTRHLAFGGGPHFCLGAWLARVEVEILLPRLLERAPSLALAVGEDDLRWERRTGLRALRALPLTRWRRVAKNLRT